MNQRFRFFLSLVAVTTFALAGCSDGASGGDDPGAAAPRGSLSLPPSPDTVATDVLVYDSDRTGNFEIYRSDEGEGIQLTSDERYDSWWGRISPDRRHILFYRSPAGIHDRDHTRISLWVMAQDGSGQTELRPAGTDGWALQGHAEWSPTGEELVMFGGAKNNPQLFVTDATGQAPRQVTDRGGVNLDPSWSPDGESIFFVGCPRAVCLPGDYEIYQIDTEGAGEAERLTSDSMRDHDPYVSPDGTELAWLTRVGDGGVGGIGRWDIRIMALAERSPIFLTDDEAIDSRPEWSREGEVIYFHRLEEGAEGFSLFRITVDGHDLEEVTVDLPGSNEYPSS